MPFVDSYGVEYSDDKKTLLKCPSSLKGRYSLLPTTFVISKRAFEGCKELGKIEFPNSLRRIEEMAFLDCVALSEISITGSIEFVGKFAFSGCVGLNEVLINVDSEEIYIHRHAFLGCENIKKVTVSDGFDISELFHLSDITEIVITEGSITIDEDFLRNCSELTTLRIPASIEEIHEEAFSGCENLRNIFVAPSNQFFTTRDGILYDKAVAELIFVPRNFTGTLAMPNSVERVRKNALNDCSGIETLVLSDALKELPFFSGCDLLTAFSCNNNSVYSTVDGLLYNTEKTELLRCPSCREETFVVPPFVKRIGSNAFHGCNKINHVLLPNSLLSIGESAFWHCSSISEITIPKSVCEIAGNAFSKSVSKINVSGDNEKYYTDGTILYDRTNSSIVFACRNIKGEIRIPEGTSIIDVYAFYDCEQITSVVFPTSLKEIKDGAFMGCENLESVLFNDSLVSLGELSFGYCNKLKTINLSKSLTTINKDVFAGCDIECITIPSTLHGIVNLDQWEKLKIVILERGFETISKDFFKGCKTVTDVTIPASVRLVEANSFDDCKSLRNIHYEGSLKEWLTIDWRCFAKDWYNLYIDGKLLTDVVLDGSTPEIRKQAFYYCNSLQHIEIREGVTSIGNSALNKTNISGNLFLPDTIEQIGEFAFLSCKNLRSISIPHTANIKDGILRYCDRLESIEVRGESSSSTIYSQNGVLYEKNNIFLLMEDENGNNYDEIETELGLLHYPKGKKANKFIVPDEVVSIEDYAFANVCNLTIIFPRFIPIKANTFYEAKVKIMVPVGMKQKFINGSYPPDSIFEIDTQKYLNVDKVELKCIGLVTNNPFRTLGVFVDASLKEITANKTKLARYASVGKSVAFDADMDKILPPVIRTTDSIDKAYADISLPQDKIRHAFTWFAKGNNLDEIALNHIGTGNYSKAHEILEKKETWSSLLNQGVLALLQKELGSAITAITHLIHDDEYRNAFILNVCDESYKINEDEISHTFIDLLLDGNEPAIIQEAFDQFGESGDDDDYIKEKIIGGTTERIKSAIAKAKNDDADDSSASYRAGKQLMDSTKADLAELKVTCGENSSVYGLTADSLAKQILQCGINYYNNSFEDQYARIDKAMELQNYALSIAIGSIAKERCKKNVDILLKIKSKLPPKEIKSYHDRVYDLLDEYKNGAQNCSSAIQLIKDCAPHLVSIKTVLGTSSSLYLSLSTTVVNTALITAIDCVNRVLESDSLGRNVENVKKALKEGWMVTLYMDRLDKEKEFYDERYKGNRDSLKKLIEQLRGFAAGGMTFVNGKMVRTPSEYNVFGESLRIDLDMRTEEEFYASCKSRLDYENYLKRYPNGKFVAVSRQKLAEIEKVAWGKCNTLNDFWDYLKQYPNGEYRVEAARRIAYLEERALWQKCKDNNTIEDYQKYLNSTKLHQHTTEANAAIQHLKEEQSKEEELWAKCRTKDDFQHYLQSTKHGLHRKEAELKLKKIDSQKTALILASIILVIGIGITLIVLFT